MGSVLSVMPLDMVVFLVLIGFCVLLPIPLHFYLKYKK